MSKCDWTEWLIIGFVLLVFSFIAVTVIIQNSDERSISLEVTDKSVKPSGEDSKYLVYCIDDDNEVHVLEITDTLIRGRFNSSDEYAAIEVGKKYTFTVVGKRIPFLSMYPNILSHKENKGGN